MCDDSPSPGPIADDAKAIAERLRQIQKEEGRREPWAEPAESQYTEIITMAQDFATVMVGGVEFQLEVDQTGSCKLTPIPTKIELGMQIPELATEQLQQGLEAMCRATLYVPDSF